MKATACLLVAAALLASACDRRDHLASPDSAATPATPQLPERSAYLSVSDLTPDAGGLIVVAATLRVSDHLSLGSFRVRLGYDSTKLHFVQEFPAADMMRVVNPQPGNVVVVGATTNGSLDGRLFEFRFRVDDPAGINSLALSIDEMNDSGFIDQKATITRASTLVLDRSLAGKAIPR